MTPRIALTIAGSDSGGGAGVQADLRTFAAHAVHGATAFAALTAQNTVGVQAVHALPAEFVVAQVTSVLDDLQVRAVKTGMLATAENVHAVAALARRRGLPNLVVDPVMVASTGARLLEPDAERAYRRALIPVARVITPNRSEAGVLVGAELQTLDDVTRAARALVALGPELVVITGGGDLASDQAIDVVVDRSGTVSQLRAPRIPTGNDHGTGCSFASAIAARLALGDDPRTALRSAKHFVHRAVIRAAAWNVGAGPGPIDHLGWTTSSHRGATADPPDPERAQP